MPLKKKLGRGARPRSHVHSMAAFVITIAVACSIAFYTNMLTSFQFHQSTQLLWKQIPTSLSLSHPLQNRMAHIVLVENRDLQSTKSYGYYTFAMWQLYTNLRPEANLLVYNSSSSCAGVTKKGMASCMGYNGTHMSPYWMKVLAVRNAMDTANEGDFIVFMDADMHLNNANFTANVFELKDIRDFLQSGKPMLVIDERYASHWYLVINTWGCYHAAIVSNYFIVINNHVGRSLMETWWQSMNHPTPKDSSGTEMLWGWPWEQNVSLHITMPHLSYSTPFINRGITWDGCIMVPRHRMFHLLINGISFDR